MATPNVAPDKPVPSIKLLVCVGGTGKIVGLAYVRLAKLLGYDPKVSIVDFRENNAGYTDVDRRVDEALRSEGVTDRVYTLPDGVANLPRSLKDMLKLPPEVADAILTAKQQDTPPIEGANQEPQVGATLAAWKLQADKDKIRTAWFNQKYDDIYFVAGLGGGTGAGFAPMLADFARESGSRLHGVYLLPWQKIGDQGVGDAGQARNARSVLHFIRDREGSPFNHIMVLGNPRDVAPYDASANMAIPVQPTLLLAALYVLLREAWGGTAQLTERIIRMEIAAEGISLGEISGPRGSLFGMLVHSLRLESVLTDISEQSPDQRLSKISLWPLALPLSWSNVEWLVASCAHFMSQSREEIWRRMKNVFTKLIKEENHRRNWIIDLAEANRGLISFEKDSIKTAANRNIEEYKNEIKRDNEVVRFEFSRKVDSDPVNEACQWLRDRASQLILDRMTREKK